MTERTLSPRALNRALLARQLLLERSSQPLPEALEQVGGLQTQYAPSGYIGLWSRLGGFRHGALTEALEQRRAVQATLMRVTIHTVSAGDYWPLAEGTRDSRQELYRRNQPAIAGLDMDAAADLIRRRLADGPLRQKEIVAALEATGYPRPVWAAVGQWVDLVRVPPSGTWERPRADLFGLAELWLGPSTSDPHTGRELLLRRYLAGFGPGSINDAANWAGLPVTVLKPIADRMDLVRYRDEQGTLLLDLPEQPMPDEDTPAPVRFLGTWDANLLVHARRTQFLPERFRPLIFSTKTPHSFPTFLVDGAVAGTWKYRDGDVQVKPFEPLAPGDRRAVEEEASRLVALWDA
jgi:hypothetical protein